MYTVTVRSSWVENPLSVYANVSQSWVNKLISLLSAFRQDDQSIVVEVRRA